MLLLDPDYVGRCENNGYEDTGLVCENGGSCYNNDDGTAACSCIAGGSGRRCERFGDDDDGTYFEVLYALSVSILKNILMQ